MASVKLFTFGNVNKEVGWDFKEVELEQDRATVEGVLKTVSLGEERTLFDLVADEKGTKEGYTILMNGRSLWSAQDLKVEVKGQDSVTAMGILHPIGGG